MILNEILENLKLGNDRKAYTINEEHYTYKQLYMYVCNLYNYLLKENIDKQPIIVYGHKEVYMKSTFLACSFAGITYVPIDESMPKERIQSIIGQVKPKFIVGDLINQNHRNISKDEIYNIMNNHDYKEIDKIYLKPSDIYYIIFTSGSTGMPKGVKVTYKNLDSCINWLKDITKIENGVILNQANFSFDLSVADLYLSITTKSEHYIIDNTSKMNFMGLYKELKQSNAKLAIMTPSFADLLCIDKTFGKEIMPNLDTIVFCGEKLLNSTLRKLYSRFSNIKIINCYGPTECTFAVTSINLSPVYVQKEEIPVGIPKKDVDIIIVDENINKLADGQTGEILIIGESVADGYLGKDSSNVFINYNGKKAYLTGDLGYIKDNILYYKCRKDKQIKFKGYRIELADIEENLSKLNYIEKIVVLPKLNKDNKVTAIIAFIKLKENYIKEVAEIKKDIHLKLPDYMCPHIRIINEFPINKNGKCDEKKLLERY